MSKLDPNITAATGIIRQQPLGKQIQWLQLVGIGVLDTLCGPCFMDVSEWNGRRVTIVVAADEDAVKVEEAVKPIVRDVKDGGAVHLTADGDSCDLVEEIIRRRIQQHRQEGGAI